MATYHYAIETLLKHNVNKLPIKADDVEKIIKNEGWELNYYDLNNANDIDFLKKLKVLDEASIRDGLSYKRDSLKIVFIRNNLSTTCKILTLAHELGHIRMGHFSDTGILGKHSDSSYDDQQEIEANKFLRHFLAPECNLKSLRLKSIDEIEKHTSLKDDALKAQFADFKMYKSKYTLNEQRLIGNFTNYINENKKKPNKKIIRIAIDAITTITALILAISLISARRSSTIKPSTDIAIESDLKAYLHNTDNYTAIEAPVILAVEADIANENKGITVFKAKTGKVYHKTKDCSYIKGNDGIISMQQLSSAQEAGLNPCSRCYK